METILSVIMLLLLLPGILSILFLALVQPIWAIVDVAVSKNHSGGTKAAVIIVTLLCLGVLMTLIYGCFMAESEKLRKATLFSLAVLVISGVLLVGMAIVVPQFVKKLPVPDQLERNLVPPAHGSFTSR